MTHAGHPPKDRVRPFSSSDAVAALIVGLAALSFYLSAAGLLFQGVLAPHLPMAIGAALMGGALLSIAAAWRGALPLASVGAVPTTVPVLAAITGGIATAARPEAALPTAVLALSITAMCMGALWWVMGRRGWGGFTRFIPYPVIGGFMGATGWLMSTGGLGLATGQRFSWQAVTGWLSGAADARLWVGVAFGGLLWFVGQRRKHPLVLPLMLLGGALALHAGLVAAGIDLATAHTRGWLQAPFDEAYPAWPLHPAVWSGVQWPVLLQQAGWMVSCVIVGTLSMLVTTTSLEIAWDARGDINRDLRALGLGNLLAGAAGGLAGGISLSRSVMNKAAGARSRASGLMLAVFCLVVLVWGGRVIALVPLPLLGGLLLAQGLEILKTWLIDARSRLTARDHAIVLTTIVVTAALGFLPAMCLGVLACCVDFVVSQAQVSPVRRMLTRTGWLSNVERERADAEWLMQQGSGMVVVELQGVLFFGSTTRLSELIDPVLDAAQVPRVLLFDFMHVRTLDSSAAQSLARLFKAACTHGSAIALSGLRPAHEQLLRAAGALDTPGLQRHADIDAAVTAWDTAVLARRTAATPEVAGLEDAMTRQIGPALAARLLPAFETVQLAAGQVLFERGAVSDALYVVASGSLAIVVPGPDGQGGREVTVRTVVPGGTIGEMGLFRHQPRSASVRADTATVLLKLSAAQLETFEAHDPSLAAALYRLFVQQMASRVEQLTVQAHQLSR